MYKVISVFLFQILFLSFSVNAAGSPGDVHWGEYKASKRTGKVKNITDYVESLYTVTESISFEDMQKRDRAISYFLSTGGKNGFAKRSATPEERIVLENAMMFSGMVAALDPRMPPGIELKNERYFYCQNGNDGGDKKIKKHLAIAQRYFAMGRLIGNWKIQKSPDYVKMVLCANYISPALECEFLKDNHADGFTHKVEPIAPYFTPALTDRILELWNNIPKMKPGPVVAIKLPLLEKDDVDSLKSVLAGIKNIERDTMTYFFRAGFGADIFDLVKSVEHGSRPLIMTLENGTMVIKMADGLVFFTGHLDPKFGSKFSELTRKTRESKLSDAEIIAVLGQISPIVHQFYYGRAEDFSGLKLDEVWPERYEIVPSSPFSMSPSAEHPNMDLVRQIGDEARSECAETIRKLGLPEYQSAFVNTESMTEVLSKIQEHLRKLFALAGEEEKFTDYYGQIERALESSIGFFNMNLIHSEAYPSPQSRRNARKIFEIQFETLKRIHANLQKIGHLSNPVFSAGIHSQNKKRYYFDLTGFVSRGESEKFDRHNSFGSNDDLEPTDEVFSETPEGKFELKLRDFNKGCSEVSLETAEACKEFLLVCERYIQEGAQYAREKAIIIQNGLAGCYYEKSKELPLQEQEPYLEKAAEFLKKAAENGNEHAQSQHEMMPLVLAKWCVDASKELPLREQRPYLEKAVKILKDAPENRGWDVRSQNNEMFLILSN